VAKTHLVRDDAQASGAQQSFTVGAQVADLNLGSLVLLADVITALATVQTKVNATLAQLRTQGIIAP
jgi:hypothetical protein